jgi:hypothetical protein
MPAEEWTTAEHVARDARRVLDRLIGVKPADVGQGPTSEP